MPEIRIVPFRYGLGVYIYNTSKQKHKKNRCDIRNTFPIFIVPSQDICVICFHIYRQNFIRATPLIRFFLWVIVLQVSVPFLQACVRNVHSLRENNSYQAVVLHIPSITLFWRVVICLRLGGYTMKRIPPVILFCIPYVKPNAIAYADCDVLEERVVRQCRSRSTRGVKYLSCDLY